MLSRILVGTEYLHVSRANCGGCLVNPMSQICYNLDMGSFASHTSQRASSALIELPRVDNLHLGI